MYMVWLLIIVTCRGFDTNIQNMLANINICTSNYHVQESRKHTITFSSTLLLLVDSNHLTILIENCVNMHACTKDFSIGSVLGGYLCLIY